MSTKLEMMQSQKRHQFDVSSKKDLEVVKKFLATNEWGPDGCPFYLEWPFLNVPDMLKDRITRHFLKA